MNSSAKTEQLHKSFLNVFIISIIALVVFVEAPAVAAKIDGEAVLCEINLARGQPQTYVGFLQEFRSNFQGKVYRIPGMAVAVETREGIAAVDEAIAFLSVQKPLPPLRGSAALGAAAADLAQEQSKSGATGHLGRKSGGILQRIERHGQRCRMIGENIAYGPVSARGMVLQLIIDDGVPDRGHRKNFFTPGFTQAGVACADHPDYQTICVIDFCN